MWEGGVRRIPLFAESILSLSISLSFYLTGVGVERLRYEKWKGRKHQCALYPTFMSLSLQEMSWYKERFTLGTGSLCFKGQKGGGGEEDEIRGKVVRIGKPTYGCILFDEIPNTSTCSSSTTCTLAFLSDQISQFLLYLKKKQPFKIVYLCLLPCTVIMYGG
ncbi:hypothetical protein F4809DRAFT_353813 [Biscogniauxia mediterranea]|nr:hypothetical protein F4809DRAFT_353813 [Biscogniauxia mediterranea]